MRTSAEIRRNRLACWEWRVVRSGEGIPVEIIGVSWSRRLAERAARRCAARTWNRPDEWVEVGL